MTIYVHKVYLPIPPELKNKDTAVISTVAKDSGLSPFRIGPCKLYDGHVSQNMENAWQYSKVYEEHWSEERGRPRTKWLGWAMDGWRNPKAYRYPMGKGRKPVGSWWLFNNNGAWFDGDLIDYVRARKVIYGPLYAEAVQKTTEWKDLQYLYKIRKNIVLLDYDAYDHHKMGRTLTDVLNDPGKKMGHAFVLAMLLTNDKALEQMELR